jgi:hypothetical protein
MKYTANHKLKLPEPADTLDIAVLDENFINIDALIAALQSGKADKNSPQFTGTPKAVTPSASDNSTRIATTAFVQGLIAGLQTALSNKADKNSPSLTGTPTAPTAASGTNSTQIATTAFVQSIAKELTAQIDRIKNSIGNAYLGDVIDFIDIDIIHLQYGGHSEYAFYRYRCSGARLKDGTYVSNTSGKYTDYGSRYMGGSIGNFVIGFNPNAIIVLPVTALTLENNLYAGEAVSSYKTVNAADITDWTDEREEDDYTYALYETASVRVYNS